MNLRSFALALVLLLAYHFSPAQRQRAAHWYFGYRAAMDLSSGTAVADPGGQLISVEGSAAISDPSGNLLFYTNGESVWDRSGNIMPNGTSLIGDQSAVQSSLIAPYPGNSSLYYLFSAIGNTRLGPGLYYSLIDMSQNGGLGDVTANRNNLLFSPGTEALAGTAHCNGDDYWIMGSKSVLDSFCFYAYHLAAGGISGPVVSDFANPGASGNTVGTMTFSPDGRRMAFCALGLRHTYLYGFNNLTGALTLQDSILNKPLEAVYGNAFSPDGSKLYTSSWTQTYSYISQFDLAAPDLTSSRTDLDSVDYSTGSPDGYGWFGQLRLAPDQKIYISRWNQGHPYQVDPGTPYSLDSLDAILLPDLPATACQLRRDELYLAGHPTELGLPGFISSFMTDAAQPGCRLDTLTLVIAGTGNCEAQSQRFSTRDAPNFSSIQWNFGDPASGAGNSSPSSPVTHRFTQAGDYGVTLVGYFPGGTDTARITVRAGSIDLIQGTDTLLCDEQRILLTTDASGGDLFEWQDGSTDNSFRATAAGIYWVKVTDTAAACTVTDSMTVRYGYTPVFDLGSDSLLCAGETLLLKAAVKKGDGFRYTWQDGSGDSVYPVRSPGRYSLTLSNSCGSSAENLTVLPGSCDIYLPSAFTPNGDGHNDFFRPRFGADIAAFDLRIFDRWGQLLFESRDISTGWDGRWRGVPQAAGVYVWTVAYESADSKQHVERGTVVLVR